MTAELLEYVYRIMLQWAIGLQQQHRLLVLKHGLLEGAVSGYTGSE